MADPENGFVYTLRCRETRAFYICASFALGVLTIMILAFIILDGLTFFNIFFSILLACVLAAYLIARCIKKFDDSQPASIIAQIYNHHWNEGYREEELNEGVSPDGEINNASTSLNNQQPKPNPTPTSDAESISAVRIINNPTTDENAIVINLSRTGRHYPSVRYLETIWEKDELQHGVANEDDNQNGNHSGALKSLGQNLEELDVAGLQSFPDIPLKDLNSEEVKPKIPKSDSEVFLMSKRKNDLQAEGSAISTNLSGTDGESFSVAYCKMVSGQDKELRSEFSPGTEENGENSVKDLEDIDQAGIEAIKRFDPKRKGLKATKPHLQPFTDIKKDDNLKEFEPKGVHSGNGADVFKTFDEIWEDFKSRLQPFPDVEEDDHYSKEFEPKDDETGEEVKIVKCIDQKWLKF